MNIAFWALDRLVGTKFQAINIGRARTSLVVTPSVAHRIAFQQTNGFFAFGSVIWAFRGFGGLDRSFLIIRRIWAAIKSHTFDFLVHAITSFASRRKSVNLGTLTIRNTLVIDTLTVGFRNTSLHIIRQNKALFASTTFNAAI
jgi:hypothetical protein